MIFYFGGKLRLFFKSKLWLIYVLADESDFISSILISEELNKFHMYLNLDLFLLWHLTHASVILPLTWHSFYIYIAPHCQKLSFIKKMSEKYTKNDKIRQLKAKITRNEEAIAKLVSQNDSKILCCMCNSTKISLVYCASCNTIPVCKLHFRHCPKTRKCPKCQQTSLTRRWSIPVPK